MCTPSRRLLSRTVKLASSAGAIAAVLALTGVAWTGEAPKFDEVFKLSAVIQAPGTGPLFSFDISWTDPVLNKYFLADRNHKAIDVVDPANNITQFTGPSYAGVNPGGNDFSGPDGVLTANDHTELWVGDSPGKVWVLEFEQRGHKDVNRFNEPDLGRGTTRADELCYSPKDNVIMIASPAENYVSFISTKTYKVLSQLIFNGSKGSQGLSAIGVPLNGAGINATNGLEQCQYSADTGKFYQNVPEVNGAGDDTSAGAVAVIDPTTMKVETSFPVPLDACAGPQGMTVGPHNQILLGCNAASPDGHRNIAIINQRSGALLGVLPDLGGADEVWFNEGDGHYFIASCNTPCRTPGAGAAGQELLGVVDANGLKLDQSVFIASQNSFSTVVPHVNPRVIHSVAANPNTNQVYLPIPAVGGTTAPQFAPTLCDSSGSGITVVGAPSTATGCIAVFTATNTGPGNSGERAQDDKQE